MKRKRMCPCGKEFEYEIGRGKDRKYCSEPCAIEAEKKGQIELNKSRPLCSTLGCDKLANRIGAGLCEGCYMRMRRNGTTDYKTFSARRISHKILEYRVKQSAGYIWVREPNHPLSDSRGLVYEHRFVFYERNGEGPFVCHWCGIAIDWKCMDIDHLDDNRSNNDISNLAPSCHKCNSKRGTWKMVKARREGWTHITYEGITKNASEWAKTLGLSRTAFMRRLELCPIEMAMTMPHGKTGPKRREERERI